MTERSSPPPIQDDQRDIRQNPNDIVSSLQRQCCLYQRPKNRTICSKTLRYPDFYETKEFQSVISLKAETHNFPTTVEPFNGAATGSGGEIRDRLAGGKGSIPLAGTAVYMTSYSRLENNRSWENLKNDSGYTKLLWIS